MKPHQKKNCNLDALSGFARCKSFSNEVMGSAILAQTVWGSPPSAQWITGRQTQEQGPSAGCLSGSRATSFPSHCKGLCNPFEGSLPVVVIRTTSSAQRKAHFRSYSCRLPWPAINLYVTHCCFIATDGSQSASASLKSEVWDTTVWLWGRSWIDKAQVTAEIWVQTWNKHTRVSLTLKHLLAGCIISVTSLPLFLFPQAGHLSQCILPCCCQRKWKYYI